MIRTSIVCLSTSSRPPACYSSTSTYVIFVCFVLRPLQVKRLPPFSASAYHTLQFWQEHSLRNHLLHALEGYAMSQSAPDEIIEHKCRHHRRCPPGVDPESRVTSKVSQENCWRNLQGRAGSNTMMQLEKSSTRPNRRLAVCH